jgi:hypothetical protein
VRPRTVLAAVLAFLMVGGTVLVTNALAGQVDGRVGHAELHRQAPPPPPPVKLAAPDPEGLLDPRVEVDVEVDGFLAWAALDRRTGQLAASPNATETSSTESMIKVWIVADHLRRTAAADDQPSEAALLDARRAIRDSHNGAAERLYVAGGRDAVVERMIDRCGLEDTYVGDSGWWSRTEISALDAVRLGECVADGTAAGPEWTGWLLEEMRNVRGSTDPADQRLAENFEGGRWGIIDGLPDEVAGTVAIKNGWTRIGRTGSWHLACLAVAEDWVMAVLMRYPAEYSLDYGAQRCAAVGDQLIGDRLAARAAEPPNELR